MEGATPFGHCTDLASGEAPVRPAVFLICCVCLASCRRSSSSAPDAGSRAIDVNPTLAACKDVQECNEQCSSAQPASCVAAARLYEYGHGVAADPARAFRLYDRACELGYVGGCYNAAVLLEAGRGVSKDLRRARELYVKVCEMGSNTACDRAEALAVDGGR